MSYVVGAFILAALVVMALVVPGFRLAAGFIVLVGGVVVTMFGLFFGPPIAAVGLAMVLLELHSRRPPTMPHGHGKAAAAVRRPPPL